MQLVLKIILLISLAGLSACNDDGANNSTPSSNQNGNSLAAIDSDNDGIKDSLDCAPQDVSRWQQLSYQFQDQDQDGHLISFPQVNTICSGLQLPMPYVASALGKSVGDCDDSLETGVHRYRSVNLYTDSDQDKIGSGVSRDYCIGVDVPIGLSLTDSDCNDSDNHVYQELNYSFRDEDKDNHLIVMPQIQKICAGTSLPNTYLATAQGKWIGDCDDDPVTGGSSYRMKSLYSDTDKDQLGAGDSQLLCIGDTIPEQFSEKNGDCDDSDKNKYQQLDFLYRDRDLDNHIVPLYSPEKICAGAILPNTFLTSAVGKELGDCDDNPETGEALYRNVTLFTDNDGDSYGTGASELVCTGLAIPENFSNKAGDCNDNNKNEFQELSYHYRDADLDGHFEPTSESRQVCSGLHLPSGYSVTIEDQQLGDCDDGDVNMYRLLKVYADSDGDNFGTGEGEFICVGLTLPNGYANTPTDCNDENENIWQTLIANYQDADGDGYFSEMSDSISMCISDDLPVNYSEKKPRSLDCNDDPETGVEEFQRLALFEDLDQDGYGNGDLPLSVQCIGRTLPPSLSIYAGDIDDQNPNIFIDEQAYEEELEIILD